MKTWQYNLQSTYKNENTWQNRKKPCVFNIRGTLKQGFEAYTPYSNLFLHSFSLLDHGEKHFKTGWSNNSMGIVGRHDYDITRVQIIGSSRYSYLCLTDQNMDKGVKWCTVFTQFLTGIKSEQGHIPGIRF